MTKTWKTLLVEKLEAVTTITLNRPEVQNALNSEMSDELAQLFNDLRDDSAVRAIIITGAGRSFSAGGDVKNMLAPGNEEDELLKRRDYLKKHHGWLTALASIEKPVIAAINGYAVGAGLSIAMACDILIASSEARLGMAFVRIGLVPDLAAMYFLPRLIGLAKAKELAFSGEYIDASEAERIGLVNKVVPPEKLLATAREIAGKLASKPTRAIGLAKTILNKSFETSFRDCLDYEALAQPLIRSTSDFKEGVRAFLEKRPAEFKGR